MRASLELKTKRTVLFATVTAAFLAAVCISRAADPAAGLIPRPQMLTWGDGVFTVGPQTRIVADSASYQSGEYLAAQLRSSTGYPFKVVRGNKSGSNEIFLTTKNAKDSLGAEGYDLAVARDSVTVRAPAEAGIFYGIQTLLQLFPPKAFANKTVTGVDWTVPCVQIEDWPRFQWRGMMLDVSRHFYTKEEVERLLDQMARLKLNRFHWHLVDHDGWRIEIKKYPNLTKVGAWRPGIGWGIDPRASTAYGPDGRYGGFYTQEEIREVVAYAEARYITIIPEIEMPGHSWAALNAYPQFNCIGSNGAAERNIGVYCAGNDQSYIFLENILQEVFSLFPGKYIHVGGDEVDKSNWEDCPLCQARMKKDGLTNEDQLESYFIRRIETFVNAHGRRLIGWSEILRGGLAPNAMVMDWIGGGKEAASQGHDVVMSPGDYCYFDHYQSLDYSTEPVAIGCYLPLWQAYSFEPIPDGLPASCDAHILGGQANVWTEYIASTSHLEYMIFPRLCALAEVVWSSRDSRNWGDFQGRLKVEEQRLDEQRINRRRDDSVEIGAWTPGQATTQGAILRWNVSQDKHSSSAPDLIGEPAQYHIVFEYRGGHAINISRVSLMEDRREIARDTHAGFAGPEPQDLQPCAVTYVLSVAAFKPNAQYAVEAQVTGVDGDDSSGVVYGREIK